MCAIKSRLTLAAAFEYRKVFSDETELLSEDTIYQYPGHLNRG